MPEIDLRALSTPVEQLRDGVAAAYKTLDERWDRVAKQLKKLPIPCDVAYAFWIDQCTERNSCLEWRKWNGARRICVVYYEGYDPVSDDNCRVVPYEEWSGQQRLDLLQHVPKLFERAAERTKDFIDKVNTEEVI